MNLIKEKWTETDVPEFQEYLREFENCDEKKKQWFENLLKTALPILGIKTPVIKEFVREIIKGSYLSFLDLMIWEYHENTAINGFIISKIKDFDIMKRYLDIYSEKADNWATCDLLSFDIKGRENQFMALTSEYIGSDKPFVRRIGLEPLLAFAANEKYLEFIFQTLNKFENENDYYVNMMNAWILCECIVRQKGKAVEFLKTGKLNRFTCNKVISKCRDSFRLTKEEKDFLLQFKK